MASIYRRDNGVWYLKFRQDGRWVYRSLGTRYRRIAQRAKREFEQTENALPHPLGRDLLTYENLRDLVLPWARQHRAATTVDLYAWALKTWIAQYSNLRIAKTTRQEVEDFKRAAVDRAASPRTVNSLVVHLKACVGRALRQHWYEGPNPFAGVERVPDPRPAPRWLDTHQIAGVMTAAGDHSRDAVLIFALGIYAGLRKAEIVNARWEWVDFEAGLVHAQGKGGKRRTIPLHDRLGAILREHRRASGWIVAPDSPPGVYRYRYDIRKIFAAVVEAAGLDWCTPHVLRHTFASQLVSAGVDLYKVSVWLGHASYTTTQIYAHLRPADQDINRF